MLIMKLPDCLIDSLIRKHGKDSYEDYVSDKFLKVSLYSSCNLNYMSKYMGISFPVKLVLKENNNMGWLGAVPRPISSSSSSLDKGARSGFDFSVACRNGSVVDTYVPLVMNKWHDDDSAFDYGEVCPTKDCDLVMHVVGGSFAVGKVSSNAVRISAEQIRKLVYE